MSFTMMFMINRSSPTQGDPGATECSITTSEEQEETVHELRGNGACAPVEIVPVPEDNDVIQNCKDPDAVAVVEGLLNSGASLHIKSEVNSMLTLL